MGECFEMIEKCAKVTSIVEFIAHDNLLLKYCDNVIIR